MMKRTELYHEFDRSFFGVLREELPREGVITEDEVRKLANALVDLDTYVEQLIQILRKEIIPAIVDKDYQALAEAFGKYDTELFIIQDFQYIKRVRKALKPVLKKFNDRYKDEK